MTRPKMISDYLKKAKKDCPLSYRKKLTADLENNLFEYLEGHPGCTDEDIALHFGPPGKFADEYLLTMDAAARKKALHNAAWIRRLALTGIVSIIIATFIILVTAVWVVYENHRTRLGYYTEYIIEYRDPDSTSSP